MGDDRTMKYSKFIGHGHCRGCLLLVESADEESGRSISRVKIGESVRKMDWLPTGRGWTDVKNLIIFQQSFARTIECNWWCRTHSIPTSPYVLHSFCIPHVTTCSFQTGQLEHNVAMITETKSRPKVSRLSHLPFFIYFLSETFWTNAIIKPLITPNIYIDSIHR